MIEAKDFEYVIIADGHFNPLGLARSLGRAGIPQHVVVVGNENALIAKSKYPQSMAFVDTPEQAILRR